MNRKDTEAQAQARKPSCQESCQLLPFPLSKHSQSCGQRLSPSTALQSSDSQCNSASSTEAATTLASSARIDRSKYAGSAIALFYCLCSFPQQTRVPFKRHATSGIRVPTCLLCVCVQWASTTCLVTYWRVFPPTQYLPELLKTRLRSVKCGKNICRSCRGSRLNSQHP